MTEQTPLSAEEIVDLSKRYTLYDWQAQSKAMPLAVERAEGVYFYDDRRHALPRLQLAADGREHRPRRQARDRRDREAGRDAPVHLAVHGVRDAGRCSARSSPTLWPGDLEKSFFTLGGAEANENAIRIAKAYTGRQKVLARYRSYHGATYAHDQPHRRPAPLGEREPADARRGARARPVPRHRSAGPRTPRPALAAARGDDRARGSRDDRGVHPGDRSPARTGS